MKLEIDGAGPLVEGCGTDRGCRHVGPLCRLGDGYVGFGAEDAGGVVVHSVERVGCVHAGDGHVARCDAIAVHAKGATGANGRSSGSCDQA